MRTVPGLVGDTAGGILYAVLIYSLIATSAARVGGAAVLICTAIELLQLTGLPSALGAVVPSTRFVLGTTFVWTDLVTGAVGALVAMLGDEIILRLGQRRRSRSVQ
jgi:Protein of unknown function (DUF2809)